MVETVGLWLAGSAAAGGTAAAASAGGAAAAAAGTGIAAAAGTGLTWGTALSLANAGLSILGGFSQAGALNTRSGLEELQANQEIIRGAEESNRIRQNLIATLASQNAAYGASGIDVGSGSPLTVAEATAAQADRELDTSRNNTLLRAYARRSGADALQSDASSAILGGFARGGMSLLDYQTRSNAIGRG